jgi:hypothetical protein
MKIDLNSIDRTCFDVKEGDLFGETCYLITPKKDKNGLGIKWNDENKIFRSSVWDKNGNAVSLSFRKFTNLGEQPDFEPLNLSEKITFVEKMDGSTLCVTNHRGNLVIRTRGTFDARSLANGWEIENILFKKYPKFFCPGNLTQGFTYVCEWQTPNNLIVEHVAEPVLTLIAIISHSDYDYVHQDMVKWAAQDFQLDFPKIYNYSSVQEAVEHVKDWQKGEGLVMYSQDGQILKKTKADRYKALHRIATNLNTEKSIVELWFSLEKPETKEGFLDLIDFEIRDKVDPFAQAVMDYSFEFCEKLKWVREHLKLVPNFRKDQAIWIQTLEKTKQKIGFAILTGREEKLDEICFDYVLENLKKFNVDRLKKLSKPIV